MMALFPTDYDCEHVTITKEALVPTALSEPINPHKKRFAVIFHVFYLDVFEEACRYLSTLKEPFDLYVTFPKNMPVSDVRRIASLYPDVRLFRCENRGRDVLPFLQVLHRIGTETYPFLCKLHTKKTGGSALGEVWRKLLYFDLIGSESTVRTILTHFEQDPRLCMVTGKNTVLDSQLYDYGNSAKIDRLIDACGYVFSDRYTFAGGTMFWVRSAMLAPLLNLFREGKLAFEEEKGQTDHTLAHAIERFFGILCKIQNGKIETSPARYGQLDDKTIELTASLVLSQQYRGEDAFLHLNTIIKEQQKRIDELEELADLKRRFKKNLKAWVPSRLWQSLKHFKRLVVSIKNNPALLSKVWFYLKRGEIGYLIRKIKDKSEDNLRRIESYEPIVPQHIFKSFVQSDYVLPEPIDVIIPVYNGFTFLQPLFDSIQRHTTSPYRLIVVEDASSDERVLPYLKQRLSSFQDSILIKHETNQGFVKSVNEAVTRSKRHFVILNTDTEVPAFWLERLMYPILHMDKVASSTPFTNAGTIASFPEFLADNPIFENLDVEQLDRAFRNINAEAFYEEVPTGVGFCMGVNRKLVDQIGFFDEESFGKGYGEENDWCQRAIAAGYRNLIVPNLFVYHKHGGSFSAEEKAKLIKQNAVKLLNKHPRYDQDVQAYIARDPHALLRKVITVVAASKTPKGMSVIFDHALGGGAHLYIRRHIDSLRKEQRPLLYVAYDFYAGTYTVRFLYKTYDHRFIINDTDGLASFLSQLRIDTIFLNSLVSYKEPERIIALITQFKTIYHCRLTVPIHDYHSVCPNFTLLDENGRYCGIPEPKQCQSCLAHNQLEWRTFGEPTGDIVTWRKAWYALLSQADEILVFSQSSKTILTKAYPQLDQTTITLSPHTIEPLPKRNTTKPQSSHTLTVGILGAINQAKGAHIVKDLVALIEQQQLDIKVVLIGEISEPIRSKYFKKTGRYERSKLPEIAAQEGIDVFLIPSVCPETFSYTTEEVMMMEYPIMVFNLGAPAERVAQYRQGIVIDEPSAQAVIDALHKHRFLPSHA